MALIKKFEYTDIPRVEIDGKRYYAVPSGEKLISVTTILSHNKDMTHIEEWKKNIGEDMAAKILKESTTLGTGLHKNLENYVLGKPFSGTFMEKGLANLIVKKGFSKISEVWGVEVPLYSSKMLYAGTTDMVGVFSGKPAIIDFKNSRREKEKEWITDYFLQLVAYATAHNEMFGTNIETGVIMMATRDAKYQEFVIEAEEFNHFKSLWHDKVCAYYEQYQMTK